MKLQTVDEILPDYTSLELKTDIEGWNSDHDLFAKVIEKVKPKTIIEVGSWKGRSALHMANLTEELKTKIYCCDTWLGSVSFKEEDRDDPDLIPCSYGMVNIYLQFLHNIAQSGKGDRIYPIPQTSTNAAKLLHFLRVTGDLIYIDADHSYPGVYADLEHYAELLSPGGIMFGDDYNDFPGVKAAVDRFAYEHGLRVIVSGPAWVLQPKLQPLKL